jgi:hypothetical protein
MQYLLGVIVTGTPSFPTPDLVNGPFEPIFGTNPYLNPGFAILAYNNTPLIYNPNITGNVYLTTSTQLELATGAGSPAPTPGDQIQIGIVAFEVQENFANFPTDAFIPISQSSVLTLPSPVSQSQTITLQYPLQGNIANFAAFVQSGDPRANTVQVNTAFIVDNQTIGFGYRDGVTNAAARFNLVVCAINTTGPQSSTSLLFCNIIPLSLTATGASTVVQVLPISMVGQNPIWLGTIATNATQSLLVLGIQQTATDASSTTISILIESNVLNVSVSVFAFNATTTNNPPVFTF